MPIEIRKEMEQLAEKDRLFEETRRSLFKKRCLLMKAEEKGLDAAMQATLLRKAEKDYIKSLQLVDEKITIEDKLVSLINSHLTRMEKEMEKTLSISFHKEHDRFIADVPDSDSFSTAGSTNRRFAEMLALTLDASVNAAKLTVRSSPKRRQTLNDDVPIDPNEPVYCFCNQVSFGDMIACDNPNCSREWFHYSCVGLTSPPKGKWYCKECEPLMRLANK